MEKDPGSLTCASEYMDNRNLAFFPLGFVLFFLFRGLEVTRGVDRHEGQRSIYDQVHIVKLPNNQ